MGESDKMSSDSVTNRECRAVPTPNVILLYDEHRDAVADAFVRYSRPYARFTFAVARLQQIFMLAKPRGQTPGRTSFLPRFCSDLARYLPRGGRETMQSHLWSRL